MPFTCLSKTSTFQRDRKPSSRNAKDGNNCSWSCGTRISWKLCTVLALWKQWPYFVSLSSSKSVLIRCFFGVFSTGKPSYFFPLAAIGWWSLEVLWSDERGCVSVKWYGKEKQVWKCGEKKKREPKPNLFPFFRMSIPKLLEESCQRKWNNILQLFT